MGRVNRTQLSSDFPAKKEGKVTGDCVRKPYLPIGRTDTNSAVPLSTYLEA
jgi:hypothetical protein